MILNSGNLALFMPPALLQMSWFLYFIISSLDQEVVAVADQIRINPVLQIKSVAVPNVSDGGEENAVIFSCHFCACTQVAIPDVSQISKIIVRVCHGDEQWDTREVGG